MSGGGDDFDLEDELWRAENPGYSVARGLITAVAVSAVLWCIVIAIGWYLTH